MIQYIIQEKDKEISPHWYDSPDYDPIPLKSEALIIRDVENTAGSAFEYRVISRDEKLIVDEKLVEDLEE